MSFIKPIKQNIFNDILTMIYVFMYIKDIIRGGTMCGRNIN